MQHEVRHPLILLFYEKSDATEKTDYNKPPKEETTMGLDYMIYKRNKQTGEETELAYGRKSWELVEELDMLPRDIDQYEYPLKKERWLGLMKKISTIAPYLEKIADAYHKYYWCDDEEDEIILTKEEKRLMKCYEYWFDNNFSQGPQLGYDFSVGYMLSFWEAAGPVLEALDDENYEVYGVVSF